MENRWSEEAAAGLNDVGACLYASRLLGAAEALVVWGGGNSSVKRVEADFRGEAVPVLRVKGSGSDMKSLQLRDLPALWMRDIEALLERDAMSDEAMVAYLAHCKLDPAAPRPSIETLLHGFVPWAHVYHTHADAIAATTDVPASEAVIRSIYGDRVAWVPYHRPGFHLSKLVAMAVRADPGLEGVILDKHGIITFGSSARLAYDRMISLVTDAEAYLAARRDRVVSGLGGVVTPGLPRGTRQAVAAAAAPVIRGELAAEFRAVVVVDDSAAALRFSGYGQVTAVSQRGPATPDHLLYTKQRALVLPGLDDIPDDAWRDALRQRLGAYQDSYRAYVEAHRSGPEMVAHDAAPRTVIVPGIGLFHAGKDLRAATVIQDIYRRSIAVMEGASAIERFEPIPLAEIARFEYWPLENYKLTLLPAERPLSRRIALVTGAATGIGRAIAQRLHADGALVALVDHDLGRAQGVAQRLAGTGEPLRPGERLARGSDGAYLTALAIEADVSDEAAVMAAYDAVCLAWGGVDIVVANAGVSSFGALMDLSRDDWQRTLDVNAGGAFLTLRQGLRVLQAQGMGGAMVVVASKNVTAPGRDFGAYSASKAAALQLARVAALEGAPFGVRVNAVNPDGIFGDSRFWTETMRRERAASHGVEPDQLEAFYASRNLLRRAVSAEDVAEAVAFLVSDRAAAVTGAFLPVDGGVPAAFPR